MSDDTAGLVVMAAIAAAGPRGDNDYLWKQKVNENIPYVVAMMGENSRQRIIANQTLDAQVFVATYRGYEVEKSSTRCLVQLETRPTARRPDGIEPIRSHRTDNPQGKAMQRRLDELKDGDEILVWKAMEATSTDMKVRILVHFEKLPGRKNQEQNDEPMVKTEPGVFDEPAEVDRFNGLNNKVKTKVAKRLREAGIDFPMPAEADRERFNQIIGEEEQAFKEAF